MVLERAWSGMPLDDRILLSLLDLSPYTRIASPGHSSSALNASHLPAREAV